jgi:hypothetical protein
VLFGAGRAELRAMVGPLQEHLDGLRLRLHPTKCHILPVRCGIPFLGWQVFPDHRRLRRRTGVRFQRKLAELARGHARGMVPMDRVKASVMSWIGHLKHGDTWRLRRKLLSAAVF